jgi:predicted kinase
MRLIILAGLPGTGKSSVAEAIGRSLHIPVFAKDWLEAVLRRCQLQPGSEDQTLTLGYAGYELLTMLAQRQLHLGQSVILDSVASIGPIRRQWRELAQEYGAVWQDERLVLDAVNSLKENIATALNYIH